MEKNKLKNTFYLTNNNPSVAIFENGNYSYKKIETESEKKQYNETILNKINELENNIKELKQKLLK